MSEQVICEKCQIRLAPVQGYAQGIPWSMHLEAYNVYCKLYRPQEALIQGGCRGGFGTNELDDMTPGWRERLAEITRLRRDNAALLAAIKAVKEMAKLKSNKPEVLSGQLYDVFNLAKVAIGQTESPDATN